MKMQSDGFIQSSFNSIKQKSTRAKMVLRLKTLVIVVFILGVGLIMGLYVSNRVICTRKAGEGKPAVVQSHMRSAVHLKMQSMAAAKHPIITPLRTRGDIFPVLEAEKKRVGAELGVQYGHFAAHALTQWTSCERYYLIDVWARQSNYSDQANADDAEQDRIFSEAKKILAAWPQKTVFLRMYTDDAVAHIPDDSLDYLYVDARHDYCGAKADMTNYWPKLKSGGIMAGHDYYTNSDVRQRTPDQDWGLCATGERHEGAVKGAVDEFVQLHGLQLTIVYQEEWPSWVMRKP